MLKSASKNWNSAQIVALPLGLLLAWGSAGQLRADEEVESKPPVVSKEVQDALDALKDAPPKSEEADKAEVATTHKQARSINPMHEGRAIHLHT